MRTAGRRRPPSEAGGDSYLASVSDLMSGLIFIFIITLAVFALRLAIQTAEFKTKNDHLESADRTRRQILEDIAMRLRQAGIKVEVLHQHGVLRLSEKGIHFPSGSEKPQKDHYERVGHLARVLAEVIPCYVAPVANTKPSVRGTSMQHCATPANPSDYRCDRTKFPSHLETLLIEGHTDALPIPRGRFRFHDNLELSSMRAATVFRMIESCEPGIAGFLNNKKLAVLSTSGYGSRRLAKPKDPLAKENRRIDLRFLVEPPTFGKARTALLKTISGTGEVPVQTEVRERYEGD